MVIKIEMKGNSEGRATISPQLTVGSTMASHRDLTANHKSPVFFLHGNFP